MRAFILSHVNSTLDQVSALRFFLKCDFIHNYHSFTKPVQDDWFKLMRVLGQRFNSVSHEPVSRWKG